MEKREYKVNEIFENQILNEIYETRGDGLECFYIRMYGEPEEIKETKTRFFKNKENNKIQENSFFYRYIDSVMQFLEDNRYNIWQKRKDYKQIKDKMREIKNKYANVRLFIEDRVVTANLTKEELKAVLEYINLDDEIERIEKIETFKLGLKEGNWL